MKPSTQRALEIVVVALIVGVIAVIALRLVWYSRALDRDPRWDRPGLVDEKMTIPGRKDAFRLIGKEGYPLADIMIRPDEEKPPKEGERVLCCHPIQEPKRTYVLPTAVTPLHSLVWDGKPVGKAPSLEECRDFAAAQIASLRNDHVRLTNPTPYKVSLSESLYTFMHELWRREAPVGELS